MVLVHVAYVSQALPGGNAFVVHSFTSTISTILSLFNNLSQKYYTLHNYNALTRFDRFFSTFKTGKLFSFVLQAIMFHIINKMKSKSVICTFNSYHTLLNNFYFNRFFKKEIKLDF